MRHLSGYLSYAAWAQARTQYADIICRTLPEIHHMLACVTANTLAHTANLSEESRIYAYVRLNVCDSSLPASVVSQMCIFHMRVVVCLYIVAFWWLGLMVIRCYQRPYAIRFIGNNSAYSSGCRTFSVEVSSWATDKETEFYSYPTSEKCHLNVIFLV